MWIRMRMPLDYNGKEINVSIKSNDFGEFLMFSENIPFEGEDREGCLWAELPYFGFTEKSLKYFCSEWAQHHLPEPGEPKGSEWVTWCDTPIDDESYKALKALFPEYTKIACIDSYAATKEYLEKQEQEAKEDEIWIKYLKTE